MKKTLILIFIVTTVFSSYAAKSNIKFYGQYESEFDITHKRTFPNPKYHNIDRGEFTWGWNNYLNLRIKANIGEYLNFGVAFNINMLAGNYTDLYNYYGQGAKAMLIGAFLGNPTKGVPPDPTLLSFTNQNFFSIPFYYGSTYIGSFNFDRLYFKAGNQYFDIETGLIRIPRGYGYSFSPLDLFNPKNPLNLKARPEGKLALIATFYPLSMWKIEAFTVAPDNPIEQKGWGFKFGTATKFNIDKFDFEFLYGLFLPDIELVKDPVELGLPEYTNNDFTHIAGFSLKADIEIGLFVEALYRFEHRALWTGYYYGKKFYAWRGLEASIGIDYTINIPATYASIYFLAEYMFNGSGMLDWGEHDLDGIYVEEEDEKYDRWHYKKPFERTPDMVNKPMNYLRHNYLFGLITFKFNSYVSLTNTYIFSIDDQSSLLGGSLDIEPFQAFSITISANFPLGWEVVDPTWNKGEFGPISVGYIQNWKVSAKLKF